jgi:RNA polymerase-binding transcription factor DksA
MAKTTKKVPPAASAAPAGKAKGAPDEEAKPARSPLPKAFVDEQKAVLLAERARYLKSADALKAEADALVNEREPGDVQFDEESGEGDSLAVERERDLALSAQARAAVELSDAALGRIEEGTYGICVHSGLAIPKERLEAIPWAAERVEFKTGSFRS